jgi:3-deoxy-D-manno-octulosonate 8-phosphate phosphatase (KDO 8-P phosphatase)
MSPSKSTAGDGSTAGRARPAAADLARIQLLLLDVDGVLTDGRIWFDAEGKEYKSFYVQDAAGIVYWHRCGGRTGWISGRGSDSVRRRAKELAVAELHLECLDKARICDDILSRLGLDHSQMAYVGDDLVDLPVLQRAAFAVTVPEGRDELKAVCHHVTSRRAGFGAVREVVELLLQSRGAWAAIVQKGGRP